MFFCLLSSLTPHPQGQCKSFLSLSCKTKAVLADQMQVQVPPIPDYAYPFLHKSVKVQVDPMLYASQAALLRCLWHELPLNRVQSHQAVPRTARNLRRFEREFTLRLNDILVADGCIHHDNSIALSPILPSLRRFLHQHIIERRVWPNFYMSLEEQQRATVEAVCLWLRARDA